VFATACPLALSVPALPGGSADGVSAGNRPAALPPGLSSGLALGAPTTPGRSPTDSGEVSTPGVVVPGVVGSLELEGLVAGAAVTVVASDTCGSLDTSVATATAVRRTDVTVVADVATVTFACSWRWAELASSAPRSHDALPSWLPQPKLNVGFRLVGAATRRTVASVTLPPVVQAVTVHRAACPRWILVCAGWSATQRLTCAAGVVEAARAAELVVDGSFVVADGLGVFVGVDFVDAEDFEDVVGVAVDLADVLAVAVFVGVGVGVGVLVAVGVAVDFADALAVVVDFCAAADVVAADGELLVDFRVCVVVLVGDFEAVLLADELDVGVLVGELLVVGSVVDVVGLGEGLVELGDGVGVGLVLGDGVAATTGSHCCTVPLLAVATARISPAG
jgi:hypothetical protein